MASEFEFIRRIRERVRPPRRSRVVVGIGDDAAVIREVAGRDLVITVDLLVEDIDFRGDVSPPDLLGYKALSVSLSDIAAMGARPRWSMLSIGAPVDVWRSDFFDQLYEGYFALADSHRVQLIGGDISSTPDKIVIDSFVIGEVECSGAIFRKDARPGDQIFVTGSLGAAAGALRLIEQGERLSKIGESRSADSSVERLLLRQIAPDPRVGWGILLGCEQLATSMIDVSDGLSSDLAHICEESGVGALIDAASIPVDENLVALQERFEVDPLHLALHGGEDFELLFTVDPEKARQLPEVIAGVRCTRIGEVTSQHGQMILRDEHEDRLLEPGGFMHF